MPEDFDENADIGDDDEAPKARNELIYCVGRIYREDVNQRTNRVYTSPKWVYEKWNQVVTSAKHPKVQQTLADLYLQSINDQKYYAEQIKEAHQKLADAAEERKQAAIAAAKKKGGKNKKGGDERETPAPEESKSRAPSTLEASTIEPKFNLHLPSQFSQSLASKFSRRFVFGPLEFSHLDQELDSEAARKMITEMLEASE